ARGVGVDQSEKALLVAQDNCRTLGLADRVTLKQSSWFSDVTGKFDLIVSNPPYITAEAMLTIAPDVRDWEPRVALTPGGDGLDAYREIARRVGQYLTPNGRIFVEIGWDQAQSVLDIFDEAGFSDSLCVRDLAGKDRVIAFIR
ncbi:MAG: HemK family protein methyltransferase, partial [Amylibacter sp.]